MSTTRYSLLLSMKDAADQKAWNDFIDIYSPTLHSWAKRCGIVGAEADDLVQEVLVVVHKKLDTLQMDGGRSFKAWLRTVCENKAKEFHRRRNVAGRGTGDDGLSGVAEGGAGDEFWEREHRVHVAGRALQLMRREFEETTWRACWELTVVGRPAAEVAAELGITTNACFIAKSRVLRRLRELMDGLTC